MEQYTAVDLNLHVVRYLLAVVDEGHFGRAAQLLHISAPSLSQQIRKLESQLGVVLLDLTTHPVRPTEAGRRFLPDAREAAAAADRALIAVVGYLREQNRTLRLGFITSAAGSHTGPVLQGFAEIADAEAIKLVSLRWPQQVAAVRDGTVDAAFVRPPITDTTDLRFDVIFAEPRVAVLPAEHRLADRPYISINELDGEVQVNDDEVDPVWLRWWSADPRPSGVPVRYGPVVHTMEELLEVVASRQAVAISASSVAESHRPAGVVFVPIADIPTCVVSLCTRADDRSVLIEKLRESVLAVAKPFGDGSATESCSG